MSEDTLQKARARWHSDDPMVCLQRALVEAEQLEECARQREAEQQKAPIERVIAGLANLERIADVLQGLAEQIAERDRDDALRAERRIVG